MCSAPLPYAVQAALLLLLVGLAYLGWNEYAPAGSGEKLFAKSHLVTLLVWGVWWPAMVWFAVVLGRGWCAVCPLELVSNAAERVGRGVGIRQRPLARWLASGALVVALYAVVQMLVAGAHIHRVPAYTALFLIVLLGTAAVTGFFLKDRAFCRGFCPVGLLLRVYGRGGVLAVRARDRGACLQCVTKECAAGARRTLLDARSCPTLLNPARLDSSEQCLLCLQCVKACPQHNMRLWARPLFSRDDVRAPFVSTSIVAFVMILSGFVTWELLTEWPAAEAQFLLPATWFAQRFGLGPAVGWLEGIWALLLFPPLLWLALALLARAAGEPGAISLQWRRLALPLAVILAAGHLSKGAAKFATWAPFLPRALENPSGIETVAGLAGAQFATPAPLLALPSVGVLAVLLTMAGLGFALREARIAAGGNRVAPATAMQLSAVAAGYLLITAGWIFG